MNLFIRNIAWKIDNDKLRDLFSQFGEIKSCKIITDRDSGRSKGFGFVEFMTDEAGQAAINSLNGSEVEGRKLEVAIAKPRSQQN